MFKKVRTFYFDNKDVNAQTLYEYSKAVSDVAFNYAINMVAKMHANASSGKTFFYRFVVYPYFNLTKIEKGKYKFFQRFSVNGTNNLMKRSTAANVLGFPGATHGDDLFFSFGYYFDLIL